jgi:hypothetical protein
MQIVDMLPDLGNMIFGIALLFAFLIVTFEWLERRREWDREQRLLDAIEREYQLYRRMGRL